MVSCEGGAASEAAPPMEAMWQRELARVVHEEHVELRRWAEECEERSVARAEAHMRSIAEMIRELRCDGRGAPYEVVKAPLSAAARVAAVAAPASALAAALEEASSGEPLEGHDWEGPLPTRVPSHKLSKKYSSETQDTMWNSPSEMHNFVRANGTGSRWIQDWYEWWESLKEPVRGGRLARLLHSWIFEVFTNTVILLNTATTWVATDEMVSKGTISPYLHGLDMAFLTYYCVEVVLRLFVHKMYFFCNEAWAWNMFDVLLVLISIVDASAQVADVSVAFMRSLRFLRFAKALRGFRALRFFRELRILLQCMMGAVASMFWSVIMLAFFFYTFSLIFVQGVASQLSSEGLSPEAEEMVLRHFGSVLVSMQTLYFASFGGNDWGEYYELVMPEWNKGLFIMFIFLVQITLLNVIAGIFVEQAMKCAAPDAMQRAVELSKKELEEIEVFGRVCHELGVGESLTREDLHTLWQSGRFRAHLLTLGVSSLGGPDVLYDVFDKGHEQPIPISKFVSGCIEMARAASILDMKALALKVDALHGPRPPARVQQEVLGMPLPCDEYLHL